MIEKRFSRFVLLGCVLALVGSAIRAEETVWRSGGQSSVGGCVVAATTASIDRPTPLAELGKPIALPQAGMAATARAFDAFVAPVSYRVEGASVFRAQAPEPLPPPPPPPPPGAPGEVFNPGAMSAAPMSSGGFWDKCKGWFDFNRNEPAGHCGFGQCDTSFASFISPVTSPFFAEDPRSLTEVRPLFFYQHGPRQPNIGQSNSEFLGLQGRLAINEHWSIVMNKLGLVGLQPDRSYGGITNSFGLAEINLGPKWTFLRNDASQTVAAAGLTFQIPIGSHNVFQDTGTLGLDPYLSVAQGIRLPGGFGGLNLMGTFGYDFAIDNQRTEFTHLNLHLDYNVANANTFYPLIEMNWYHTVRNGTRNNFGFEGGDLINFGSSSLGSKDLVTLALGARYKFNENWQLGSALEVPVSTRKDLGEFRLLVDFIFRF